MGQLLFFLFIILFIIWVAKSYRRYERTAYDPRRFEHFSLTREHLANSELGLFVALCAKVAKADGRVHELEAELLGHMFTDISRLFPDPERARTLLKEIFAEEKERPHTLDETARRLYRNIGSDRHKRHQMLAFFLNLAFVDGHLNRAEEEAVRKIAAHLRVTTAELDALLQRFSGMRSSTTTHDTVQEAYRLLGVNEEDSMETIKKAYRKRVREHHPDIIKAQGASEEYIQEATEKVQQINAAYETIKRLRG